MATLDDKLLRRDLLREDADDSAERDRRGADGDGATRFGAIRTPCAPCTRARSVHGVATSAGPHGMTAGAVVAMVAAAPR